MPAMASPLDDPIDPIRARLAGHDLIRLADMLRATGLLLAFERGAHPALDQLDQVATACQGLSRRLLDRPARPATSANALLEGVCATLAAWLPADITLQTDITAAPLWLRADAIRFEEVVLALVTNACDAMPDGGLLSISLDRPIDRAAARLIVTDTGRGLAPDVQPRIFEPFFSTTGGVGLGLCGVREVMSAVRGALAVDSAIGVGTRICCDWPLLPDADAETGDRVARSLLLVEQDGAVRAALSTVLRRAGHTVTGAASVAHAQGWLDRGGAAELVITDTPFETIAPQLVLAHAGPEDERTLRRPCHPDRLLARVATLSGAGDTPDRA